MSETSKMQKETNPGEKSVMKAKGEEGPSHKHNWEAELRRKMTRTQPGGKHFKRKVQKCKVNRRQEIMKCTSNDE